MKKRFLFVCLTLLVSICCVGFIACSSAQSENKIETETSIVLFVGQIYDLNAKVIGNESEDTVLSYKAEGTDVVSVENNKVTALKIGTTTVKITAIKNKKTVASQHVSITVAENIGIYPEYTSLTLYITDSISGNPFMKTTVLNADVYENDEKVNSAEIVWDIKDESVATLTDGNVITACEVGETFITATYKKGDKEYSTKNIPVKVEIPILQTEKDIVIDLQREYETLSLNELFNEDKTLGKVDNLTTRKSFETIDNRINSDSFLAGEYRCVFYSADNSMGFAVNVYAADFVVRTEDDLKDMSLLGHETDYIVLAYDLENYGAFSHDSVKEHDIYFQGVFNGLGHKISNIQMSFPLFRHFSGATVKNLCMENVEIKSSDHRGVLCYRIFSGANVIDNVYIDANFKGESLTYTGGVCDMVFSGKINITNTVVKASGLDKNESLMRDNGILFARFNQATIVIENSYFIGEGNLCSKAPVDLNSSENRVNRLSKFKYDTESEFINEYKKSDSKINVIGFNRYWDLSDKNSVPNFK